MPLCESAKNGRHCAPAMRKESAVKTLATKSTQAKKNDSDSRAKRPSQSKLTTETSSPLAVEFADNRPDAITQRKLKYKADQSPLVHRLAQLKAIVNSLPLVQPQAKRVVIDADNRSVLQRVKSIGEIVRFEPRIKPQQALLKYLDYLIALAFGFQDARHIPVALAKIRERIASEESLTSSTIKNYREEIKVYTDQLQDLEESIPKLVDSDITPEYQPLKACVIQSLEQYGVLGMTAQDYHADLWEKGDKLKYYDLDQNITPMYSRFNLTETEYGGKYGDLIKTLPVGKYIVNVDSPAGPNGHMFFLEIRANPKKKKPNFAVPKQDSDNTQYWADGDKILRYWQ
jgi:hypothetical protein